MEKNVKSSESTPTDEVMGKLGNMVNQSFLPTNPENIHAVMASQKLVPLAETMDDLTVYLQDNYAPEPFLGYDNHGSLRRHK